MIELLVIAALISLNGLFALSEFAIVSARPTRLKALASEKRGGAAAALALASNPGRLLSTVQVGITLVGIMTGTYSGVNFGASFSSQLQVAGIPSDIAEVFGYGSVIAVITYFTIVVGELVPKYTALRNAEAVACAVAPFMSGLSMAATPAVWLLDESTKLFFRPFGQRIRPAARVTEEEIKFLIAEAETSGLIETGERNLISRVMRLADRSVRAVMTPYTKVDWINLAADPQEIKATLMKTPHSRLPVGDGSQDAMMGVVQTRELLAELLTGKTIDVRRHVRDAPVIAETLDALDVLTILRRAKVPMALVYEEYGHFEGLVTPYDILETIVGVFGSDQAGREAYAIERERGSWLLSGALPVEEMAEHLAVSLPRKRSYQTVAGFALAQLHQLPNTGETFTAMGWKFEIIDLDGRRIDKVLATRHTAGSQ